MNSLQRYASSSIRPRYDGKSLKASSPASAGSCARSRSASAQPAMVASGLLSSWATPATRRPAVVSRSVRSIWRSSRFWQRDVLDDEHRVGRRLARSLQRRTGEAQRARVAAQHDVVLVLAHPPRRRTPRRGTPGPAAAPPPAPGSRNGAGRRAPAAQRDARRRGLALTTHEVAVEHVEPERQRLQHDLDEAPLVLELDACARRPCSRAARSRSAPS